jgi:hypothetical protein
MSEARSRLPRPGDFGGATGVDRIWRKQLEA